MNKFENPLVDLSQTGGANEVNNSRFAKPAGWQSNSSAKVSKLFKTGPTVGPNSLLKVMAGDAISATTQYYYEGATTNNNNSLATNVITSLLAAFNGSAAATAATHGASSTALSSQLNGSGLPAVADPHQYSNDNQRKAYLTVLFFDERFNYVSDGSTYQRVQTAGDNAAPLVLANIKAPKNGYAYVYVSNESDEPVYFDNLQVSHNRGRIVEENHYYAFGLTMAGISSKKLPDLNEGNTNNNFGYQGDYSEFDEDLGWNDFELRNYDPQIGRWIQQDPYDQFESPYVGMGNDPVNNVDPDGGNAIAGAVIGGITGFIAGGIVALANDGDPVKGAFLGAVGGALIGAGIGGGSELVNSLNISAKTVGQVAVPVLIQGSDQVAKRLAAQTVVTTVTNIATPSAPTSIPNNSGIDLRPVVNNAATKVTTPNNITQQPPVKRTTPPTANPRPRPTIPPPPTAGNATTAELAQRLIRGGRVGFAATHANRRFANDDANADDNIRDAAAGRAARTSVYGDAHGRPVNINPRLLSIIDALSQTYRLGISEIAGGDHSTNSQHYQGNAVDINSINGIHVTENNPYFRQLMRDARRLGIGLTIGPPSAGHATHVHLQLP